MKYERLTERGDCYYGFAKCKTCDCGKDGCDKWCDQITGCFCRLQELEDKIEAGTLVDRNEYVDRLMAAKDISGMTDKELEFFAKHNAKVRKQAVKEFAERLKSHVTLNYTMDGEFVEDINIWSLFKDIENLVEEVEE